MKFVGQNDECVSLGWDCVDSLATLRALTEQQAAMAGQDDERAWWGLEEERFMLLQRIARLMDRLGGRLTPLCGGADTDETWRHCCAEIERERDNIIAMEMGVKERMENQRESLWSSLHRLHMRQARFVSLCDTLAAHDGPPLSAVGPDGPPLRP